MANGVVYYQVRSWCQVSENGVSLECDIKYTACTFLKRLRQVYIGTYGTNDVQNEDGNGYSVQYSIEERGKGMKDTFVIHAVKTYSGCRGIAAPWQSMEVSGQLHAAGNNPGAD